VPQSEASTTPSWTADSIRALGTVTTVATAAAIFGLNRSVAYDLVRTNRFPVPVLRFGNRYRVPVAAILTALHLPLTPTEPPTVRGGDLTCRGVHASINHQESAGPEPPSPP
jgi:hypothetical protein